MFVASCWNGLKDISSMVMMDFINSEDDGCEPMKGPRSEPQMMSMHEEHKKIEVGHTNYHTMPCQSWLSITARAHVGLSENDYRLVLLWSRSTFFIIIIKIGCASSWKQEMRFLHRDERFWVRSLLSGGMKYLEPLEVPINIEVLFYSQQTF